jgi:hypothetical protein
MTKYGPLTWWSPELGVILYQYGTVPQQLPQAVPVAAPKQNQPPQTVAVPVTNAAPVPAPNPTNPPWWALPGAAGVIIALNNPNIAAAASEAATYVKTTAASVFEWFEQAGEQLGQEAPVP